MPSLGRYVWCDGGDFDGAEGGGVSDGERFSVLPVELSVRFNNIKLVIMDNCVGLDWEQKLSSDNCFSHFF